MKSAIRNPQSAIPWPGVLGHDEIFAQFRERLVRGRMASTFLFVGLPGIGKRTVALRIAKALLCERNPAEMLEACGECEGCVQVEAGSHPDLEVISRPAGKSDIPLELFIGDKEHRMREGLCYNISLKPYRGGRKIAIINDADYLNREGANCLLKTLEEPPPHSLLILIGTSEQTQLPTIRSRCQIVRFRPLPEATVAELLLARGLAADDATARRLAALSQGSLERAIELADPELAGFREELFATLSTDTKSAHDWAKEVNSFVEAAGKEAPPRRARMRQIFNFAADYYRHLMRHLCGQTTSADEPLRQAVTTAATRGLGTIDTAAACLDRCLDALAQVDANANQATLLESWCDDLRELPRRPV